MTALNLASILGVKDLNEYIRQVEHLMNQTISSAPPEIRNPALRVVTGGGKRVRPSLLLAIVSCHKKPIDDAVIAACAAIELLHIASLVHDDILDNAAVRHGVPTINVHESQNDALLVGDYLFAKAHYLAATVNAETAKIIARAHSLLCEGVSVEMADLYNSKRTKKSWEFATKNKTAALMSATCRIGGLFVDLDDTGLRALEAYGHNFGMAFQILDDVLDFLSSTALLGKPVGNDIREGVYTLPLLLSLEGKNSANIKALLRLKNKTPLEPIRKLLTNDTSFDKAISEAHRYNQLALNSLPSQADNTYNGLRLLPNKYTAWALSHIVRD